MYFLIQASRDPQSREISRLDSTLAAWDRYLPEFSNISVKITSGSSPEVALIPNVTDTYALLIASFPNYTHLTYTTSTILYSNSTSETTSRSGKEYNISTNIELSIIINDTESISILPSVPIHLRRFYPANSKVCRNKNEGFWDSIADACFYHYNTIEICVVVNASGHLVDNYMNGCFNQYYFIQDPIVWTTDKPFTNFQYQTFIQIRSELDPLVYASYNSLTEFSPSGKEYQIIGGTIIGICIFMLIVPCTYICCKRQRRKYLQMGNEIKSKM